MLHRDTTFGVTVGQGLNVSGDYVEVWCVPPTAINVPCVRRTQTNVIGIRVLLLYFLNMFVLLHPPL